MTVVLGRLPRQILRKHLPLLTLFHQCMLSKTRRTSNAYLIDSPVTIDNVRCYYKWAYYTIKAFKVKDRQVTGSGPIHYRPVMLYHVRFSRLFFIFQKSLFLGTLPSEWKLAEVTALHKKGPKLHRANYRPVSLTAVCCKLLECLIRDDMMTYLTDNNLICNRQCGFIKGRATSLQLLPGTWRSSGCNV